MQKNHCTIFEDNNSCIELVRCPKMRSRTNHIVLNCHHFRSKVKEGTIIVKYINKNDQIIDIFSKSLPEAQFPYLRKTLNGH